MNPTDTIYRVYVEKRSGFDVKSRNLYDDLQRQLHIAGLTGIRIISRYDVCGVDRATFEAACRTIFSETNADNVYDELPADEGQVFVVELLPGTFDNRADSAEQCLKMLSPDSSPRVRCATVYSVTGDISESEFDAIKRYIINPVESREGSCAPLTSISDDGEEPDDVMVLNDFNDLDRQEMEALLNKLRLAMSINDALFVQTYFRNLNRPPTITEIRVIDTYWSDHCRHTTFLTRLDNIRFDGEDSDVLQSVYNEYLNVRRELYGSKSTTRPVTLMDMATIAAKYLKASGKAPDLDESEEINACSICVDANIDGKAVPYLVMFKNETHNHPTEIEPFGGAATCLGGAIRDPLSGRSFVYQAMRITGCADPKKPIEDTMPGKLPQRAITTGAADGYSSYGNQIGLATGLVRELYHPGYEAKRMEIGAVIAAAPKADVIRMRPEPKDAVLLLGGRTGRDGCGGATGSSRAHDADSLSSGGAEVQKGNPLTERKLQRLFKNPEATHLIKRCNDFGAGGVSVAVGELAEGLDINLDAVPKKYAGLDGTELAISESQERMAVIVAAEDTERFIALAKRENLECVQIATVTDDKRMRMKWRGKEIVNIERAFLNTNGVIAHTDAIAGGSIPTIKPAVNIRPNDAHPLRRALFACLGSLNGCSQRGLLERFDSTVGANTVLMPLGGAYQATPAQVMAAKLPTDGQTTTKTLMSFGFDPYLSSENPFYGAIYAVLESLARIACAGGDITRARLTFQEYFEKLRLEPKRFGKPVSALLGAFLAQMRMDVPSIGGKDSMSGSFLDIDVPPTLVSFAVAPTDSEHIISGELKRVGSPLYLLKLPYSSDGLPDFAAFKTMCKHLRENIESCRILSAHTVDPDGILPTLTRMAFGNGVGVMLRDDIPLDTLFTPHPCSVLIEAVDESIRTVFNEITIERLGHVAQSSQIAAANETVDLSEAYEAYSEGLSDVFPTRIASSDYAPIPTIAYEGRSNAAPRVSVASPRVLIPVFPGTNCEYESAKAFRQAGAQVNEFIIKNTAPGDIEDSLKALAAAINDSQIIMLPGGFSAADEPDGSGKFIATTFRNARIKDAVSELLDNRDGLILGICNGFQTLIKLGLVPSGEIRELDENSPTLTYNRIGRHQSRIVRTRICSVKSPWLTHLNVGDIVSVPISHGEGRFVCHDKTLMDALIANGQIITQYVDMDGVPSMDATFNPAGSMNAIEGIISPDGRILGKMGHTERCIPGLMTNVPGNFDYGIFRSGVEYFL